MEDARITARINSNVKNKAEEQLKNHGLSISEYMRIVVTEVANNGLPKDFGYPNKMVQDSLLETANAYAYANNSKLHKASNPKELEKLLNED
ncbi:type II toxin-antitoxin system RelB/DinJ family antitoxin [Lactobacillus acetotolerans]|uniref:type II toxin-antitoxin system RelB/DinJ family antitoxin n=1 Tax=Lactobacillus acetotolerans TaxID=1600 RepID=UPI0012E84D5F|nr:type II toxin-antitoxin system RelB/DinJ family antitoxin [Lactobacillus acetotolerans]QGV05152.1 damage-inducible protein J [Lactobacillus acetotolerans]